MNFSSMHYPLINDMRATLRAITLTHKISRQKKSPPLVETVTAPPLASAVVAAPSTLSLSAQALLDRMESKVSCPLTIFF